MILGARVLALCWNSNGIKICETLSSTLKEEARKGYKQVVEVVLLLVDQLLLLLHCHLDHKNISPNKKVV